LQLADGAVFVGLGEDKNEIMALVEAGFPFVFVGRRELPRGEIAYVAADYAAATAKIVQYICEHGHTNIVYLGSHQRREAHIDRQNGFELGLQDVGLPVRKDRAHHLIESELNRDRMLQWLNDDITAFVVENNGLGQRLIETAKKLGKRIPQDFSMAVLGDRLVSGPMETNWTMFKIPRKEMGNYAVKLLVQILNDDDLDWVSPPQITLPCTIEPGNTVASPPME
jgi:DNA-binding LacI/PurR family transcriptional regulator